VAEQEVLNRLSPPTDEEQTQLNNGSIQPAQLISTQRNRAPKWMLVFRALTNATNERTVAFSVLPRTAVGHSAPLMLLLEPTPHTQLCLLGNLNALVVDYFARQKIGGTNLSLFMIQQFPILPPNFYREVDVAYVAS